MCLKTYHVCQKERTTEVAFEASLWNIDFSSKHGAIPTLPAADHRLRTAQRVTRNRQLNQGILLEQRHAE
jgi:hypothetical protein